jgi:glutamate synthase domain-containing protein 1
MRLGRSTVRTTNTTAAVLVLSLTSVLTEVTKYFLKPQKLYSNLTHRGAVDKDAKIGDGAEVLTQTPYAILERHLISKGVRPPGQGNLAVGVLFLPTGDKESADSIVVAV